MYWMNENRTAKWEIWFDHFYLETFDTEWEALKVLTELSKEH